LRKEIAVRNIQPHQAGVGGRIDAGGDFQNRAAREIGNGQRFGGEFNGGQGQRGAVDLDRFERQRFAIKHQGRALIDGVRVALDDQAREHAGFGLVEFKSQIDAVDQESRWGVVQTVNGLAGGVHGFIAICYMQKNY